MGLMDWLEEHQVDSSPAQKAVIWIAIVLCIAYYLFVTLSVGQTQYLWVECTSPGGCDNPLYCPDVFSECPSYADELCSEYPVSCDQPRLFEGQVVGEKPPALVHSLYYVIPTVLLSALLLWWYYD